MSDGSHDLHGSAPDSHPVALLIIDMINDLEFPGADALLGPAIAAAEATAKLAARAREAGIPVIYANDNFGRWRSDFREIIDHVRNDGCRGAPIAELLEPEDDDYFVLKPKHSAFYATTLDVLLEYLGTQELVLTGLTTDMCVLFTASDAFMRDYGVHIASDCVAAIPTEDNGAVLDYMVRVLDADVRPSAELDFAELGEG